MVFFFPQVLAVAIVAVLFQPVYRPDESGMINGLLIGARPGPGRLFLSDTDLALWSIIGVLVWQAVGFYVVLFSAGMASIPNEIFEAAALDGAEPGARCSSGSRCRCCGTPSRSAWVYLGIAAFDAFALVAGACRWTSGGPDGATTVLALEIYRNAVQLLQVRLRLGDGRGAVLPDHRRSRR